MSTSQPSSRQTPSVSKITRPSDPIFDPRYFVTYFERNANRERPTLGAESDLTDIPALSSKQILALQTIVSLLALGEAVEGQMGNHLARISHPSTNPSAGPAIALDQNNEQADQESLRLYALEEERHAAQLLLLLKALGLPTASTGPKASLMKLLARAFNLGSLLTAANLILSAEVLTVTFYREMSRRIPHPLVEQVTRDILKDEAGHVNYHAARLSAAAYPAGPFTRLKFKLVHQAGLFLTLLVAALMQPSVHRLTGLGWKELLQLMRRDYQRFFLKKPQLAYFTTGTRWVFTLFSFFPLS